ncbi:unnamed protein product [Notodromas monacha]|uniref:Uncharacterized protein n=1 Tax=Notodromas monacha TaxID=399045 RepID=A0A7R9GHY6_9CRUS|nr:unnamed protein product [Notodromas monacha]CAG0923393.1 unnamed protein product [Notodromas monacha]
MKCSLVDAGNDSGRMPFSCSRRESRPFDSVSLCAYFPQKEAVDVQKMGKPLDDVVDADRRVLNDFPQLSEEADTESAESVKKAEDNQSEDRSNERHDEAASEGKDAADFVAELAANAKKSLQAMRSSDSTTANQKVQPTAELLQPTNDDQLLKTGFT